MSNYTRIEKAGLGIPQNPHKLLMESKKEIEEKGLQAEVMEIKVPINHLIEIYSIRNELKLERARYEYEGAEEIGAIIEGVEEPSIYREYILAIIKGYEEKAKLFPNSYKEGKILVSCK